MSYDRLQRVAFDWLRDKNINYIARDKSGCVYGFRFKPKKVLEMWVSELDTEDIPILVFEKELSYLKWEDVESFEIPILNFTEEQEKIFEALRLFGVRYLVRNNSRIYGFINEPNIQHDNHLPYTYVMQMPETQHLSFLAKETFRRKAFRVPEKNE